jgi:hypothetical protein
VVDAPLQTFVRVPPSDYRIAATIPATRMRMSSTRWAPVVLVATLLVSATATASAQAAPHTVRDGRITSDMQPAIRIEFDTALTYVGSQRWPLYNVVQAEQHLFVHRTANGVDRFLWVQFEQYLPTSKGRYDYSGDAPLSAFGLPLRVSRELWNMPTTEKRPESDGAYARRMLREHGITLPAQMLSERFIYLPDSTNRRELMVIYAEDAMSLGASSLPKEKLDALLADLERRALKSFAIERAR